MKLYRTYTTDEYPQTSWATSQAGAASARKRLYDAGHKRANVVTEEVVVPTKKQELCEWLNQCVK